VVIRCAVTPQVGADALLFVAQPEVESFSQKAGAGLVIRDDIDDVHHPFGMRARDPLAMSVHTLDVTGRVDGIHRGLRHPEGRPEPNAHCDAAIGDKPHGAVAIPAHLSVGRDARHYPVEMLLAIDTPDHLMNADAFHLRPRDGIFGDRSDNDV
jgi:hypothetical protein